MADHADTGLRPFHPVIVPSSAGLPVYPTGDHATPPAGLGSPEARLVDVSRMSLCARIKHGVPLADLLGHFQSLAQVEANLVSYKEGE